MNKHVRGPLTGSAAIPDGILAQEQARQEALTTIRRLRREARDEIERLLSFLDASDTYVMTEREENGDEADASYPESGVRVCSPMEDDEAEPSLGSSNAASQLNWGDAGQGEIDAEDEHDGGEPENEHGDRADYEPSLGWTTDGVIGNTTDRDCDLEAGVGPRRPQGRTAIPAVVTAEPSYRRFLHGLTPDQHAAMQGRMRERSPYGGSGDVVLR